MRFLKLLPALFLIATPAMAQITVIGTGISRSCFEAVKSGFGSMRENIDTCTKALESTPLTRENRLATYVNRGILFMRDGQYDRSLKDINVALSMDQKNGTAWLNKGAVLIHLDDSDAALEALNKAIEFESRDLHAVYYNRALVMERKGDVTAAYFDLLKSLELNPEFELATLQLQRFKVEETS